MENEAALSAIVFRALKNELEAKARVSQVRLIQREGKAPYLFRAYLNEPASVPGHLLHRFESSDQKDEFHSHPWEWAVSLILDGAYSEERIENGVVQAAREFQPGDLIILRQHDFHRVDLITPTVTTLFITGPRVSTWGFVHRETKKFREIKVRTIDDRDPVKWPA